MITIVKVGIYFGMAKYAWKMPVRRVQIGEENARFSRVKFVSLHN